MAAPILPRLSLLARTAPIFTALWLLAASVQGDSGTSVELELLLAVDASSSVDGTEFELQIQGIANAFRDPSVLRAIIDTGQQGIAVSVMQWSGGGRQDLTVNWTRVYDIDSAARLSETIAAMPRVVPGGDTSLRGAIRYATRQFDDNGLTGARKVIDISGDGGAIRFGVGTPNEARDEAVARHITINGLAILNEVPNLDSYYAEHVIGGAGAFVMTAADYDDFGNAIIRKLIQEIGERPIAEGSPPDEREAAPAAQSADRF